MIRGALALLFKKFLVRQHFYLPQALSLDSILVFPSLSDFLTVESYSRFSNYPESGDHPEKCFPPPYQGDLRLPFRFLPGPEIHVISFPRRLPVWFLPIRFPRYLKRLSTFQVYSNSRPVFFLFYTAFHYSLFFSTFFLDAYPTQGFLTDFECVGGPH